MIGTDNQQKMVAAFAVAEKQILGPGPRQIGYQPVSFLTGINRHVVTAMIVNALRIQEFINPFVMFSIDKL